MSAHANKRSRTVVSAAPEESAATASADDLVYNEVLEHNAEEPFKMPGLILTNHRFKIPLDHRGETPGTIEVFAREVVATQNARKALPYLLFLQGGPGFESPRPTEPGIWIKSAIQGYRVILLDQRGTGLSTAISCENLVDQGDSAAQAAYLKFFRSDSIVADAELIRKALLREGKWTLLGQSYGGFCITTYLSLFPDSVESALYTGGIPPGINEACSAETVYRATYESVLRQNAKYYSRYPGDADLIRKIVLFLDENDVVTPSGNKLTPRAFQILGMSGLGSGGGFERLHYLLEGAFDGDRISAGFMKGFDSWMPWDTNPLYVLLHEPIYSQGAAPAWAADRVRAEYNDTFDAVETARKGGDVMLTGEMVFPWMFDDFAALRPLKGAAEALAADDTYHPLYNVEQLRKNKVTAVSATYLEDMYVDYNLAQDTAKDINGIRLWVTNEYMHSGIRDDGARIFDKLMSMATDQQLTF